MPFSEAILPYIYDFYKKVRLAVGVRSRYNGAMRKWIAGIALAALLPSGAAQADVLLWTQDGYRMAAENAAGELLLISGALEEADGLVVNAGVMFTVLSGEDPQNAPDEAPIRWSEVTDGDGMDKIERAIATPDGWLAVGSTSSTNLGDTYHEGWYDGKERMTDAWALRLDDDGGMIWSQTYGGSDWDSFHAVCPAHGGGWIAVGSTYSGDGDVTGWHDSGELFRKPDGWIAHLDETGAMRWQRAIGGSGYDEFTGVAQVPGGYMVVGITDSADGDTADPLGDRDAWILLLDEAGEITSQRRMGGADEDTFAALAQGPDGWLAVGASWSFAQGEDREEAGWAVCLDAAGETVWTLRFGKEGVERPQYAAFSGVDAWLVAGTSQDGTDVLQWLFAIHESGSEWKALHGRYMPY